MEKGNSPTITSMAYDQDVHRNGKADNFSGKALDVHALDHFFVGILYNKARLILQQLTKARLEDSSISCRDDSSTTHTSSVPPPQDELEWIERLLGRLFHYLKRSIYHQWIFPILIFCYIQQSALLQQTPAGRALGLRMVPQQQQQKSSPLSTQRTRVWVWAFLSAAMPIFQQQLRDWVQQQQQVSDNEQGETSSEQQGKNDEQEGRRNELALRRRLQMAQTILGAMDGVLPLLKLGLLLRCWALRGRSIDKGGSSSPGNSNAALTTDPLMWLAGLTYTATQLPTTATTAARSQQPQQGPVLQVDFAHRRLLWDEGLRAAQLWLIDGLSQMHVVWKAKDLLPQWLWNWLRGRKRQQQLRMADGLNQIEEQMCILCQEEEEQNGLQHEQQQSTIMIVPMEVGCCCQRYCYACLCLYARETPGLDFDCPACGSIICMEDAKPMA